MRFYQSFNSIRKAILKSECRSKKSTIFAKFLGNLGKKLTHEARIFPKFHKDWAKTVDFLLVHSDFKITFLIKLQL